MDNILMFIMLAVGAINTINMLIPTENNSEKIYRIRSRVWVAGMIIIFAILIFGNGPGNIPKYEGSETPP